MELFNQYSMTGMMHKIFGTNRFCGARRWLLLLCGLLCFTRAALATDPLYQNDSVLNYTIPGNPPPTIDATNFVNNNSFTVNWETLGINTPLFETEDTVNYTNNDLMVSDTGFRFDTETSNGRQMAGSFYNPGDIQCGSIADEFFLIGLGQMIVSATNIVNPGTVDGGEDGLIQFSGGNVDLTRSTLTIEGFDQLGLEGFILDDVGLNSLDYGVGTDTNADWDPSVDLQPNFAISSEFNSQLFPAPGFDQIIVEPSIPYYHVDLTGTNYVLTRAVFINSNPGANVTQSVFFGGNPNPNLGPGFVTVQWAGSYVDPATGRPATNYLYLNDFYVRGANTNNPIVNGIPSNFTFTELAAPAAFGVAPAASNFPIFSPGVVTNNYSYVDAQLIPTTVATNAGLSNPSGALTNLSGRIQITATRELNLNLAQISGPNYMSLTSINQFDGSQGATIASPFSDISLGSTNGILMITNLLEPSLPRWNGTLQAWSSDWLFVDTNGVTNEFRVMLLNPNLSPTTLPQVQNLALHGTNLIISDMLNIFGTLSIDAQNLTLTTNLNTGGVGSQDGELNLQNTAINWATSLPNLRNLTNNGAIRSQNAIFFGGPSPANYLAFINNGLVSDNGSAIWADNFENSGTFSNGIGSFTLQSLATTLTNNSIIAGGDIAITTVSLLTSNLVIQAGRSLTLAATNLLTDTGPGTTNGNIWTLGSASVGSGFNLPIKPSAGDLLGTTITNIGPTSRNVVNTWAAADFGVSTAGYTNNAAIGRLILDSFSVPPRTEFTFNGTGVSNAIYVDYLELQDEATNRDGGGNFTALNINTNLVIYYAQAVMNGLSVAEKMNHKNNDHLRWVPSYAGYYSSTNVVYPDGTTNSINAALAQSTDLDSDGDGIDNANDPTPIFTPDEVNFTVAATNIPPLAARLTWQTIPDATNTVLYRTNLTMTSWLVLTNFVTPPAPPFAPITTNAFDVINPAFPKFYRVLVSPNSTDFSGP
jgi:hypothetical protein